MTAVTFPEANTKFCAPDDLSEAQCQTIPAFSGKVSGGSIDGAAIVVVAWQPSPAEIEQIGQGKPIFLSCVGGLPPHFLCTSFQEASNPA